LRSFAPFAVNKVLAMPFIPHTEEDVSVMLGAIGAKSIEDLFDEIPPALKTGKLKDVPDGLPEMAVARLMQERASQDGFWSNFIGAGVYEHHIPAAIWQITTRGEFYSAYTPYQAEASQGTLQLIYEYQTMMTRLTGLDVSNASLYDGASALAEAVLMAVQITQDLAPRAGAEDRAPDLPPRGRHHGQEPEHRTGRARF
jgi:glycine dehydrogenase subunit 1